MAFYLNDCYLRFVVIRNLILYKKLNAPISYVKFLLIKEDTIYGSDSCKNHYTMLENGVIKVSTY